MQNKKSFLKIIILSLLVCCGAFFAPSEGRASDFLDAYALDTIAGVSTTLFSSATSPHIDLVFDVVNPMNKVFQVPAKTNFNGKASVEFPKEYTSVSGVYRVSVRPKNGEASKSVKQFNVLPASVSPLKSSLSPLNKIVSKNEGKTELIVALYDDFGNPISGRLIKLISSESAVEIKSLSGANITDKSGNVVFELSCLEETVVQISAYDVASETVLNDKANIAFLGGTSPVDFAYLAFGNSSGPIHHFEFENIPDNIYPAETVSFTVTAYDATDQVVSDYLGTVRFSVSSDNYENVSIPSDYTFALSDQGSHTFSLGLSFQLAGEYELEVRDIANPAIFAEEAFVVVAGSGALLSGSQIVLSSPVSGTYSNNTQNVIGEAQPGARIKIYDNDIHLTSLVADQNGNFSYTTPALVDGNHSLYAAIVDNDGTILATSDFVSFSIDTTAPEISEVMVFPEEIIAGSEMEVRLYVAEGLGRAVVLLGSDIYEMTDTGQGFFVATFSAPSEPGEYPLDFLLTDQLGNESRFSAFSSFSASVPPEIIVPVVGNLVAIPSDSRVTLSWSDPFDPPASIAYYRVFYGLSPDSLVHAVDTFTNATTWYVSNLENGVRHYFAVLAIDVEGRFSESASSVVSAVPEAPVISVPDPEVLHGVAGQEALEDLEEDVSGSGPAVWWLLFVSPLFGIFYTWRKKFSTLFQVFC